MSFVEKTTVRGVRCDKRNCSADLTGEEMPLSQGQRHYETLATQQGWTIWVGRRRVIFCPSHGPSRRSTMWQDTPLKGPGDW